MTVETKVYQRHDVPAETIEKWQKTVGLMADIFEVPAGLIMHVLPAQIEVLLASRSYRNPYEDGEKADRDIKPRNLLACCLGPHYDFVKLLDFGIVRISDGVDQTVSSPEQWQGTPATLSPEAAKCEEVTFASDFRDRTSY